MIATLPHRSLGLEPKHESRPGRCHILSGVFKYEIRSWILRDVNLSPFRPVELCTKVAIWLKTTQEHHDYGSSPAELLENFCTEVRRSLYKIKLIKYGRDSIKSMTMYPHFLGQIEFLLYLLHKLQSKRSSLWFPRGLIIQSMGVWEWGVVWWGDRMSPD